MTREEFAKKWGMKPAEGYGNALFDFSEALLKDLDEVIKSELPSAEGAEEILKIIWDAIQDSLEHMKMHNIRDEDDNAYPLLDYLTPDGETTDKGSEEILYIVDNLALDVDLKKYLQQFAALAVSREVDRRIEERLPQMEITKKQAHEYGKCYLNPMWGEEIEKTYNNACDMMRNCMKGGK